MSRKRRCSFNLYTNFLIANHNRYSTLELAKVAPPPQLAHDSVSRWLHQSSFTPSALWREVKPIVELSSGYLIGDDTLLDKPRSRNNELARVQYSGNHHGLINGICLVNLLWSDGSNYVPIDYRCYDKSRDDKSKNDHYLEMLHRAESRGFKPKYVLNDSWYGSVSNLKAIDRKGWKWICNLKSNRQVSEVKGTYIPVADLELAEKQVKHVWLKEYGTVVVCRLVDRDGDTTYLASNDLGLGSWEDFTDHWSKRWQIEQMHRGLKQTTGIAGNSATKRSPQLTHIFAAFVAFIRLEKQRRLTGVSWYEQKAALTRPATRSFLQANA